jgi:P27 family predicted phage terminase small subunit
MARGRKKGDPRDQRSKGYPGKRKSKTDRELEAMAMAAERDAQLLAAAGAGGDLQVLPIFLNDPRLKPATMIWREYAPRLDKLNLLTTLDRHTFSMFCIYAAEFVLANKECLDKGFTIMVTTVAGSKSKGKTGSQMPRDNPALARRDFAAKMMLGLSEKFGFTPLDRNKLIREHAMQFDAETLFGQGRAMPSRDSAGTAPDQPAGEDIIGSLNTLDTPTPGKMN